MDVGHVHATWSRLHRLRVAVAPRPQRATRPSRGPWSLPLGMLMHTVHTGTGRRRCGPHVATRAEVLVYIVGCCPHDGLLSSSYTPTMPASNLCQVSSLNANSHGRFRPSPSSSFLLFGPTLIRFVVLNQSMLTLQALPIRIVAGPAHGVP